MSTGEVPGGDVEAERALIDERERAAYKKKTQEHCKEVLRQVELKRKSEELYNHGFGWQTDVGIDPLRVQDLQVPFRSAQEMRNKSKENSR